LARERVRARGRARPADPAEAPVGPDTLLEQAETERLVGLALTELAPHHQRALLDKYVHRRSFAEMAAAGRASAKAGAAAGQRGLAEALAGLGFSPRDGGER